MFLFSANNVSMLTVWGCPGKWFKWRGGHKKMAKIVEKERNRLKKRKKKWKTSYTQLSPFSLLPLLLSIPLLYVSSLFSFPLFTGFPSSSCPLSWLTHQELLTQTDHPTNDDDLTSPPFFTLSLSFIHSSSLFFVTNSVSGWKNSSIVSLFPTSKSWRESGSFLFLSIFSPYLTIFLLSNQVSPSSPTDDDHKRALFSLPPLPNHDGYDDLVTFNAESNSLATFHWTLHVNISLPLTFLRKK